MRPCREVVSYAFANPPSARYTRVVYVDASLHLRQAW
jgi:hypothetical protein